PDELARALADRPGAQRPARLLQRRPDLRLLLLQAREVALELLALRVDVRERVLLVGACPCVADARAYQLLLHGGDRVAVGKDAFGDALVAVLEATVADRAGLRVGPGAAHELEDPLGLLGHAAHELAALEEGRAPPGVEGHG